MNRPIDDCQLQVQIIVIIYPIDNVPRGSAGESRGMSESKRHDRAVKKANKGGVNWKGYGEKQKTTKHVWCVLQHSSSLCSTNSFPLLSSVRDSVTLIVRADMTLES